MRDGDLVSPGQCRFEGELPSRIRRYVLGNVGVVGREIGETLQFRPLPVVRLGIVDGHSPSYSGEGLDEPPWLQEQHGVVIG